MDTHNKKTHTDKRTLTLEEKEARILASIPKKYLTKKGKIRILGDSEIDRLIEEDPDLFERMHPFIMERINHRNRITIRISIISLILSISCILLRLLL